jgi:hypothetical protein
MMKYFVRYDPETGNILSQGFMEERHIESLIESGQSILIVDAPLENMSSFKINLETGKIEYILVMLKCNLPLRTLKIFSIPPSLENLPEQIIRKQMMPQNT